MSTVKKSHHRRVHRHVPPLLFHGTPAGSCPMPSCPVRSVRLAVRPAVRFGRSPRLERAVRMLSGEHSAVDDDRAGRLWPDCRHHMRCVRIAARLRRPLHQSSSLIVTGRRQRSGQCAHFGAAVTHGVTWVAGCIVARAGPAPLSSSRIHPEHRVRAHESASHPRALSERGA